MFAYTAKVFMYLSVGLAALVYILQVTGF